MYIKERKNRLISQSGLTLIELMVVIVILGLLAALVAPEDVRKARRIKTEGGQGADRTFRDSP